MSWLSRLLLFFPSFHLLLIGTVFYRWTCTPSLSLFLLGIGTIYLFPLILFRIHHFFFPLQEGRSYLDDPHQYSPWWGGHQIQLIFCAFPFLESLLRLIPGLYSFWLRLWGSKIGKNVYWTPLVVIEDRNLMEVGHQVLFGHKVECYAHVVYQNRRGRFWLYTRKIRIGDFSFIGAGSRLGPGACVPEKAKLPILTDLRVNQTFKETFKDH
jgi:hypothetical protein